MKETAMEPIPMILTCPSCSARHIDEGTKMHHTHACQTCGMVWRPAVVPTVGVKFLPGFFGPLNEPPASSPTMISRVALLEDYRRFDDLKPGQIYSEVHPSHRMEISVADGAYKVYCASCAVLVHPHTTGPAHHVEYHLRHPGDRFPGTEKATTNLHRNVPPIVVCMFCQDTHKRSDGHMCTQCPTPCQECRQNGNGPYCTTTPCACVCHEKQRLRNEIGMLKHGPRGFGEKGPCEPNCWKCELEAELKALNTPKFTAHGEFTAPPTKQTTVTGRAGKSPDNPDPKAR